MMEVTPHLKTVLKNYQHSATKSLQGPGLSLVPGKQPESPTDSKDDLDFVQPQPFPIQQLPILTTADKTYSERSETTLEGQTISCFVVGGEKRLCLPQVLNSVLGDFTLPQINEVCDKLLIYCSRCTPEQLNVLKSQKVLPSSAPSCGLITKTDAERLCSALLHPRQQQEAPPTSPPRPKKGSLTFTVYHECFGKCRGLCVPEMYTGKTAKCIECADCHSWFSPQQFVCHVHRDPENRTVHWGFDSGNWRSYVLVTEDQAEHEQYAKYLDEMKEQFEGKQPFPQPDWNVTIKRKLIQSAQDLIKQEYVELPPLKKNRLEEYIPIPYGHQQLYATDNPVYLQYLSDGFGQHGPFSAFKPFGPSRKELKLRQSIALANRPPEQQQPQPQPQPQPLPNNDRVVPSSPPTETIVDKPVIERNGYQPNVSLAPPTPKKFRYIKASMEINEVSSSSVNSEVKVEKPEVMQKSPDSQLIDSTVSIVQSIARYNSEIELSTDTDDTASVTSDRQSATDLNKIEDLLKTVDAEVIDPVLKLVRNMAKEREGALLETRTKEDRIRDLEAKISELERRLTASPLVNGVCDTHNHHPGADTPPPTNRLTPTVPPDSAMTPPPPPPAFPETPDQSSEEGGPEATSTSPAADGEGVPGSTSDKQKSVITSLDDEAITTTPSPE